MTIVLLVLKITGWILLAILILVVLLLAALLFIPFRYRLSVRLDDSPHINGSFSWLLHLVSVRVSYEDGRAGAILRVLFIRKRLFPAEEAADDAPGQKNKANIVQTETPDPTSENDSESAQKQTTEQEQEQAAAQEQTSEQNPKPNPSREDSHNSKRPPKKRPRLKDRLRIRMQRLQSGWRQIKETCKDAHSTLEKLQRIKDNVRCKDAFSHLKKELFRFLKMICPKKLRMDLRFSAGTPDVTGMILGVCAMFPVTYRKGASLAPDFESEQAYAKGFAELKGRIFLYQLVGILLRIISDKDCIYLYRRLGSLHK